MAQIFQPIANSLAKASIVAVIAIVGGLIAVGYGLEYSGWNTQAYVIRDQPVPFSHKHHAGGLGIDCRYCHVTVEVSSFAGIPQTEICMSCHVQIWADSPMLAPVRDSFRTGAPIQWNRVHDLPGFVYFNHSIHINKGVGCSTCHGRVDLMPLTMPAANLQMSWCLDCHREPERYLRPRDQVFNMAWQPPGNQLEAGRKLLAEYHVRKLTDCYTCHR